MLCWSVLLLAVLLMTAATQDSKEQQKEEEEIHNIMATGPGPPQNVTVTPVGSNALNVSWEPPDVLPLYYIIKNDTIAIYNTSNTYYLMEGLEPCHYYDEIKVVSRYDGEQYPAKASGTTNTPEPPPPQSCWFSQVHKKSLYVNWKDAEFGCNILNHSIRWSWDVLWSDEEGSNETIITDDKLYLNPFQPYTNVTANVAAASSAGFGQPITCWNVTLQDTPGAPVITSITSYELSLNVSWLPPEEANGELGEYEVNIKSEEDGSNSSVYTSDTEADISTLSQCEPYLIKVRAQTRAGTGPYSQTWNITHNVTVAPNFVQCRQEESNITACWVPCSDACLSSSDHLDLYNISWHGDVLWSSEEDCSGSGSLSWSEDPELCYQLPGPYVPYTNYSVCVSVDGQVTATGCCSVQTQQAEPGPPVNLRVTSYDGSATVTWTPPDKANGVISIYEVNCESGSHSKSTNVTGEDTEAVVDDLQVCENYSVTVRALTEAGGWGPESQPAIVTIDGALVPSSVECSPDEDVNVRVCWTPSPRYCPMSSYNITWDGTKLWTHNTDHDVGSSPEPWKDDSQLCHQLSSPEPYTNYTVCVGVTGYNTVSACCHQRTPEAASSAPTDLTVVNQSYSQAGVSWSLPDHLNGELQGWYLFWTDSIDINKGVNISSADYTHTINDLQPSTDYIISLMARNGKGLGAPAFLNLTTDDDPGQRSGHVGLIVGASVGGALVLALVVGGLVFTVTRRSKITTSSWNDDKPLYASPDSLSFRGNLKKRRMSESADLVDSGIQNYPLQRRASATPGVVSKMDNYPVKRRASEASLGVGQKYNYPLQRRASEVPSGVTRMDNYLQRRKSEASIAVNSRMMRYPELRRSSEAFGGVNSRMQPYYGQRRASEVPGGLQIRKNYLPRQRRASETHDGTNNGSKNYPLHRRTSEVPRGITVETQNMPINRSASEIWGGVNNEIKQFHRQLRASGAPDGGAPDGRAPDGGERRGINNDGNNYHGQRRASERYAGIKPRGNNFSDHRRQSLY